MTLLYSNLPNFDVLESIPDALLITTAEGGILFVNTPLLSLFGFSQDELLGQPLDKLMPERFRRGHQSHVASYDKDPYVRPMGDCSGFYALHKNGEEFPVEIYLSPIHADGQLFIAAAIRDITKRQQLEEELRRSRDELEERVKMRTAELEETAQRLQVEIREHARSDERILQLQAELSHTARLSMIGEMAAGLGHEINQPLAAINNYAQGCIRRIHGGTADDKSLVDALQRISREASRTSEIIARFRRFAKKEQLQREWINTDALVCDAIRLAELESTKYGVAMDLRLSGILPQLYVDPIQIQQVIVNLVRNAIEASLEGAGENKSVSIQVSGAEGDKIKVSVSDKGHGLLAESVDHLFQQFFTTKTNGLGMGLSLSHRIIQAHGGELSAYPNEDQGMTFYFVLPVADTVSYAP
jgi:PAS domain S-box-containing protein